MAAARGPICQQRFEMSDPPAPLARAHLCLTFSTARRDQTSGYDASKWSTIPRNAAGSSTPRGAEALDVVRNRSVELKRPTAASKSGTSPASAAAGSAEQRARHARLAPDGRGEGEMRENHREKQQTCTSWV